MTQPPIRFATDILVRLGEELNPSLDQGILELVKNSYDADAAVASVRLESVLLPGGTIEIVDDGDGLTRDDIVNGWLVLGKSRKNTKSRTRKNRIPAGNKGLGRLAAMRLGREVTLTTRPRGSSVVYEVTIDWSDFDLVDLVEDVAIKITERDGSASPTGTRIVIRDLVRGIGRMEVKRLARAMILLADPFDTGPDAFTPQLASPDFRDLEELVNNMYFDDAEYHLVAHLDDGLASAEVLDWKGRVLFQATHEEIANSRAGEQYGKLTAQFDLWAFILTKSGFETRSTSVAEVRSWIESFGGVHLYLNGLRVAPYGNAGNDWLDINLRRVQSPEERPSTNTSIGRVLVEDVSGFLTQKTDRSGFIENATFEDLRDFAKDALEWMSRRRLAAAEARRRRERSAAPTRAEKSRASLKEQIEQAPPAVRGALTTAFASYDKERQRETDALRREVQLYRTLSTAGITAATFAHESGGYPLKIIGQSVSAIDFRARKFAANAYDDQFADPIASIRHASDSLSVLSEATLQLIDADKRRTGKIELHRLIRQVINTFTPLLQGRDVVVGESLAIGEPYLRGTEASIESILTNLINNSLTAFEASTVAVRRIDITTEVIEELWRLTYSDNGPGIDGISVTDVWLPGQTTRPNGTGLGLTIVRDAIADLDGSVETFAHGPLGGATFVFEIPILGVDR